MIESIQSIALAFDTGVLTLIWLVQLVIYPSFLYYGKAELKRWHTVYTRRVSMVVLPLMIGQLGTAIYLVASSVDLISILHLLSILIAWIVTFLVAVPLHNAIDDDESLRKHVIRLIRANRYRTIAWTITWVMVLVLVF